jgi:hypothetical protein
MQPGPKYDNWDKVANKKWIKHLKEVYPEKVLPKSCTHHRVGINPKSCILTVHFLHSTPNGEGLRTLSTTRFVLNRVRTAISHCITLFSYTVIFLLISKFINYKF